MKLQQKGCSSVGWSTEHTAASKHHWSGQNVKGEQRMEHRKEVCSLKSGITSFFFFYLHLESVCSCRSALHLFVCRVYAARCVWVYVHFREKSGNLAQEILPIRTWWKNRWISLRCAFSHKHLASAPLGSCQHLSLLTHLPDQSNHNIHHSQLHTASAPSSDQLAIPFLSFGLREIQDLMHTLCINGIGSGPTTLKRWPTHFYRCSNKLNESY